MTAIRWSLQAVEDLEAIRGFIARDSSHYAHVVVQHLIDSVEQLVSFPESGRIVPEIGDPSIRELVRAPYRVVYRPRPGAVEILTVFHASRPIPGLG